MKNLLVMIFILFSSWSNAAVLKITGKVIDQQTNSGLGYVNIQLLQADSTFIQGVVTNEQGEFTLDNIQPDNFLICISCIGYDKTYISTGNLSQNINIGEITLHNSSIQLDDITITGSSVTKKIDRQIILPTKTQIKAATNGLTLLRNLQLSRIVINPIDNSIKLSGGENVQLRINNIEVSQAEIIALKPSDILKVEYHDNPGVRYDNAGAVINYITKKREDGGNIAGDFTNGISNTGYGEHHFSGKYNHKKSELSTNIYWSRRDLEWTRENYETFRLPENEIKRIEMGEPTKVKYEDINFTLNYNYQEPDNYLFNVRFRNNHNNTPNSTFDRTSTLYQDSEILSITDQTTLQSNIPSLDIYYQRSLKNQQQLIFNLVGTYLNTSNKRTYKELSPNNSEMNILSEIKGEKYSLIAEAIYEKHLKQGILTGGIKHTQSHLQNKYAGNVNNIVKMNTAETYAYAEYQFNKNKLNYVLGIGAIRTYNTQQERKYEKYIFRPSVTISYNIKDNLFVRYSGHISGYTPSLSDLNNVTQDIDSFQIRRGNPDLKTVTYYTNEITLNWYKKKVAVELIGRYNYDHTPVMESTYIENNKFIRSVENHKGFHRITLQTSIQYLPYKEHIAIKVTPFLNRYISNGNTYTHTHTNFGVRGSLMAMYNNWTFIAEMNTSNHLLWGETLTREEKLHTINIGYNKEKWTISAGVLNPFTKKYQIEIENLSEPAPYKQVAYSTKLSPIFFMNFTFNLDFGRRYNSARKKINNQDVDTGILSGKK